MNDLPFPDRPRLRYIDERFRPDFFKFSKRYTLVLLANFGFAITFAIRSNECMFESDDSREVLHTQMMTVWFLLAYFLIQIPAGIVSYKYSATQLFGFCILGSSIVSFMTPLLLIWWKPIIEVAAFLQGIFQGAASPAFYSIWRYWAPPLERATLIALGYSGTFFGVVIGYQLSLSFCNILNWEKILYVYGLVGILWYILWIWLVFEHPSQHPTITDDEYLYLKQTIDITPEKPPIPWKQILTNKPVWALFVGSFCRAWYVEETQHAKYSQVTFMAIHGAGAHIELLNLIMGISVSISGYAADLLLKKTTISVTNLRKIFISGGLLAHGLFFIGDIFFLTYESFLLYPIIIIYCASLSGFYVNHLDIAARYAGITMSIANLLSTIASFLPYELDMSLLYFVDNRYYSFIISMSIVYMFGASFYGIFGSSEQQTWAKSIQVVEEPKTFENLAAGNEWNPSEILVDS